MQIKDFKVKLVDRNTIANFIETWHYSKSINGCISNYCFALYYNDKIIGAMFYGRMAMANQYKKFSTDASDVIELRRLCCIDDTPKNTESFFIAKTLKYLKKNTNIKIVVSYADAEHGHTGIIYKASNFEYAGFTKGAKVIVYNNKIYHDKAIRTKYKGNLKPFAVRLKQALEAGDAYYKNTKGKHTYTYSLRS